MSYASLRTYCQTLPVPVSRKKLYPKIKELCGLDRLQVQKTGIDPNNLLGFFLRPGSDANLANWSAGTPTIVVARALNYCWERFVVIKEMMHLFDGEFEKVGAREEFEALINEMIGPLPERSVAMESEVCCFWRAIGIVCPEGQRQEFHRLKDAGKISNLAIAEKLRIPELYVPNLFDPNYKAIISSVM